MTQCPLLTVNTCILEQAHQIVSITPRLLWGIAIQKAVKSKLAGISAVKLWPPGEQTSGQAGRRRGGRSVLPHHSRPGEESTASEFDQIAQIRILYNTAVLGYGQGHAAPGKPIMEFSFFLKDFLQLKEEKCWCRRITEVSQRCFLPITVQIKDHHGREPITAKSRPLSPLHARLAKRNTLTSQLISFLLPKM